MGQVEAGMRTDRVRGRGDASQVERLAGAVLHAGPQYQRQPRTECRDPLLDVVDRQPVLACAWRQLDELVCRVETVPGDLGRHHVPVG